jgi:tetratricopeptide (TPR) repeat protein
MKGIPMVADDGFDTVAAISALESTLSLFSDTLQLASMAFQFVPGMAGVAGVLSGVSSGFDKAAKVLDGIDKVRAMCDKVIEIYDQHPDPAAHPQVAGALITKAFTLIESGRLAEALSVYDDLVRRFGADTDPSVVRSVRWARINATGTLNKLQRFEETLARCGEIVERYGSDPDPAVVVDVLSARLNRMEALAELQRTGEAVSCFDEIVSICDGFDSGGAQGLEIRIRQDHVSALGMKSMILLRQGKVDEALAASDEVIERFGADQHLEVRSVVARCLLARAAVLHHFERWQEEIDAYNEILTTYSKDRSLRDVASIAGYGKVGLLLQLGRFKDAVHACDDLRQEFRNDRAVQVTTTAFEVEGYRGLGQHKKALKACDEVVDLIGSDPDAGSRRFVAGILRLKAQSLWALGRWDEVLSVCEEIDRRFGGDPDLILRQEVAQAMLDKGKALGQCGRWNEAAAAMDTVVARYGKDAGTVLKEMSARARSNKIVALGRIGAGAEGHLPPAESAPTSA